MCAVGETMYPGISFDIYQLLLERVRLRGACAVGESTQSGLSC